MSTKEKHYSNGELTVVWKPDLCIHSKNCFRGLPQVFNPDERPWIKADAATSKEIEHQIKQCPTGALSYFYNNEGLKEDSTIEEERIVEVVPNGPLMVYGNLKVKGLDKEELKTNRVTAFCRCGASNNKPYCDGTHNKIEFKD